MLAMLEIPKPNEAIPADPSVEPGMAEPSDGSVPKRPDFTCGKRSYPTKLDARCMRNHIRRGRRRKQRPRDLRIYECDKCGQWHLTSVRPRKPEQPKSIPNRRPQSEPSVDDGLAA